MAIPEPARLKLFERFPLFRRLPEALADAAYRTVRAGTVLFDEHTPCSGFPLILDGVLRVFQRSVNGREVQLYRVKAGESCLLTSSCLLGGFDYTATGIADTPMEIVILPAAAFSALLGASAEFRAYVFGEFGDRLGALTQMVEAVMFKRLGQRLAQRLLSDGGECLELTHQALADEIGSVREIISRLLHTFEDRGWVELGRERITIRDRAALARIANAL